MFSFAKALCLAVALITGPALAHERLALVIGNAGYRNIPDLDNPLNDARLMRDTLQDAGFKVTMLTDADRAEMTQGVERFEDTVRAAGSDVLVIFYFAGHGLRSNGFNYLIPLGVNIQAEDEIAREAISAEWVLDRIHTPEAISIMILDACRDNPFDSSQPDALGTLGDGLARMTARSNNLIAYATGPGDVALDGTSTNSPYTAALARAIQTKGLRVEDAFEQVRLDVVKKTGGVQAPWARSSLGIRIGIEQPRLHKR